MNKQQYIQIKERFVQVPLTIEDVSWEQYRKVIEAHEMTSEGLTHLQIVTLFMGEDEEYWRNFDAVNEWALLAATLYKLYLIMISRPVRTSLKVITISEILINKKTRWERFLLWIRKVFRKTEKYFDSLPYDQIVIDKKTYHAPSDLSYRSVGQYQDALEVTSVIHEKTETVHYLEAMERLFKIYFHPIVSGEIYSPEKALAWDVSKARFVDVVDFGSFFLTRLNGFLSGIVKTSHPSSTVLKKSKQASMKSEKDTNSKD